MSERHIGIDFGTTTSAVYYANYMDDHTVTGSFLFFPGSTSNYVPSLIYETEELGEPLFGWDAQDHGKNDPGHLHSYFKMDLLDPKKADEAKRLTRLFFKYLYDTYQKRNIQISVQNTGTVKTSTVVTYPVRFSKRQQNILKKAAEDAGFPNVTMVTESESAMWYASTTQSGESEQLFSGLGKREITVMSIDMGAGTTDISVFEFDCSSKTVISLLGYSKDAGINFGGREIDLLLADFYERKIGPELCEALGDGDTSLGKRVLLRDTCLFKETTISKDLNAEKAMKAVPGSFIPTILCNPGIYNSLLLDRELFEDILGDYLKQFPALIKNALQNAGRKAGDVDLVVLTGGHSVWYFIHDMLCSPDGPLALRALDIKGKRIWPVIRFEGEERLAVARGAAMWQSSSNTAIKLKKIDLPGPFQDILYSRLVICSDGSKRSEAIDLYTGAEFEFPYTNLREPECKGMKLTLRYDGKIYHGLMLEVQDGHNTRLIAMLEEKTLIFTDYQESDAESELSEEMRGTLRSYDKYSCIIKPRLFTCKSINGEALRGYCFYTWYGYEAYYVFTDALIGGFFHEGLCTAQSGALAASGETGARVGYLDLSGAWMILPRFSIGTPFHHGIARVSSPGREGDNDSTLVTGLLDYQKNLNNIELWLKWRPSEIVAMDRSRKYFLNRYMEIWGIHEKQWGGGGVHYHYFFPEFLDYIRPPTEGKMLIGTDSRVVTVPSFYGPHSETDATFRCGYLDFGGISASQDIDEITIYERAKDFHNGMALIKERDSGGWGLISADRTILADCRWDILRVYKDGTVIGFKKGFAGLFRSSGGTWYRASKGAGNDAKLNFTALSGAPSMDQSLLLDSSEQVLDPPWTPFPEYIDDVIFPGRKDDWQPDVEKYAMYEKDYMREQWDPRSEDDIYGTLFHYYSDGFYTVFKDGLYSIYTHSGTLLSQGWKRLARNDLSGEIFGTNNRCRTYLAGSMEEDGWHLFSRDVLRVYDGEHCGLLGIRGNLLLSPEWDNILLYEKFVIAYRSVKGQDTTQYSFFDYSGRQKHEIVCDTMRYDGKSDYLAFSRNKRLAILDLKDGTVVETAYAGIHHVKDGDELEKHCGFTEIHKDMLAIINADLSYSCFLDHRGQKIRINNIADTIHNMSAIEGVAYNNEGWFIFTKDNVFKVSLS